MIEMRPTDYMTQDEYDAYIQKLWEKLAPLFLTGHVLAGAQEALDEELPEFDAKGTEVIDIMKTLDRTDLGSLFMTAAGKWAALELKDVTE